MDEKELEHVVKGRIREVGQREAARQAGVSAPFINDVYHGRRTYTAPSLLNWLGLEKVVTYRKKKE